ncbi:class I SAM-dependent methyltransferase [Pokkaliibacter sp. CJK22405]|uniref:class I SAM-dependent methyltransferase n=1 Tax=Pokkaliibacter sp. CJK22405 TaxID=3384615 RepID=UPI0039852129
MDTIFDFLTQQGLIETASSRRISDQCRDAAVAVFRDQASGVVYLDPQRAGKGQGYTEYYTDKSSQGSARFRNEMDQADSLRRSDILAPLITGKVWLDFGCGPGYQLRQDAHLARSATGVELNAGDRNLLQADGFHVVGQLETTIKPQVISLFHVLEHLLEAPRILRELYDAADKNALLIIEVPHGKDWILTHGPEAYRQFTFWSEHLVLHTHESLRKLLTHCGWQVTQELGVQRYPAWNHFHWLTEEKPSGLKATVMDASARQLQQAYEAFHAARNTTDTLLFVAVKNEEATP